MWYIGQDKPYRSATTTHSPALAISLNVFHIVKLLAETSRLSTWPILSYGTKICVSVLDICSVCSLVHSASNKSGTRYSRFECRIHCIVLYCIVLYCIVLYCGRVPAAKAPGCTAAEGLLYKPWSLLVPTCTARCTHHRP